jgi:hypothetical protein
MKNKGGNSKWVGKTRILATKKPAPPGGNKPTPLNFIRIPDEEINASRNPAYKLMFP